VSPSHRVWLVAYRAPGRYTNVNCACWMNSRTGSGRGTTGHELGVYSVRAIVLPSDSVLTSLVFA